MLYVIRIGRDTAPPAAGMGGIRMGLDTIEPGFIKVQRL